MTTETPAGTLPAILQYQSAPELVRLHEMFQRQLEQAERKANTAVNLRTIEAMKEFLLPLYKMQMAYATGLEAALSGYVEQLVAIRTEGAAGEGEVAIGLDPDTVADFDEALSTVTAALESSAHVQDDDFDFATHAELVAKAVDLVVDIREALRDLELDVEPAGEGEEDGATSDEDEEDDLNIV